MICMMANNWAFTDAIRTYCTTGNSTDCVGRMGGSYIYIPLEAMDFCNFLTEETEWEIPVGLHGDSGSYIGLGGIGLFRFHKVDSILTNKVVGVYQVQD